MLCRAMARKPRGRPATAVPDLFSGLEPPPAQGPDAPTAKDKRPDGTAPAGRRRYRRRDAGATGASASAARGTAIGAVAAQTVAAQTPAAPFHLPPGARLVEIAPERGAPGTFTYLAEAALAPRLTPGARVLVPFGPRAIAGYVVGTREPESLAGAGFDPARLKSVLKRLDVSEGDREQDPLIAPALLDLARWIARQYACPLGSVLAAILPAGVKRGASAARARLVNAARRPEELREAAAALASKAPKQAALLHAWLASGEATLAHDLLAEAGANDAALRALVKRGLVSISEQAALSLGQVYEGATKAASEGETAAPAEAATAAARAKLTLTPAQSGALAEILQALASGAHRTFLLQGVTGSGKTEVYLRALTAALKDGRQGLVLVPEIALTPQTAARFEERLGAHGVAVLHSHLTDGERAEAWRAVRAGKIGIVIGARSALFAPLERLGCIVVDEEHEGTFKQDNAPRYHAREVALERARAARAVLVLGSATPSLESAHAARAGRSTRLLLPERVRGAQLPPVQIVSMQEENRETQRYNYLSRALERALRETLDRREQAILFLNRRGYATVITCRRCGRTERCDRCDITLTSHRQREILTCHYCGMEKPIPKVCSACGAPGVKFWGLGTERVEKQVKEIFPNARAARMDSDTMTRRSAYVETLSAFRAGNLDILIGTQMIAKGLDFPNVTLVGIVLADTALHMPDFRSRERTFQLLEQVAGRAGRGEKGGRVLVQTYLPKDPAVLAAAEHDYEGFAEAELRERHAYGYPPFTRLARVLVRGKDLTKTQAAARQAGESLRAETQGSALQVLGPSAAPISMLEGEHRIHLLVKAPDGESLAALFAGPAGRALEKLKSAEATVDVDPQAML
jgi:primosomal protein N' (replication factor Y)